MPNEMNPKDDDSYHQWIVDVRPLWPVNKSAKPKQQMAEFAKVASRGLQLLPGDEQEAVLKYFQVKDARLSLVSHLMKHYIVARLCKVPWSDTTITRAENGKPRHVSTTGKTIEFNVSHQAGVVTAIAGPTEVGTDVVCVSERDDFAAIEAEGFFAWVDLHADVFAPSETESIKRGVKHFHVPSTDDSSHSDREYAAKAQIERVSQRVNWDDDQGRTIINARDVLSGKFRHFYAIWCLREAYVKMTGEALMAEWLQKLEFRKARDPRPDIGDQHDKHLLPAESIYDFDLHFDGSPVTDVAMELTAIGNNYMVASAIRRRKGDDRTTFPGHVMIDVERDIYDLAHGNL